MKLIDYKKEIIAIARAQNVAWDVARDMFLANIRNAGHPDLPHYSGADEVPYKALQAVLPDQQTREYAEMCSGFNRAFQSGEG